MKNISTPSGKLYTTARIVAAVLLLQTLVHKFGGTAESRALFEQLGAQEWSRLLSLGGEPTGRILSGISELIVGLLLLFPKTSWLGALGAMGMMVVAMIFHVFILGIDPLFGMAVVVFACSAFVAFKNKDVILSFLKR